MSFFRRIFSIIAGSLALGEKTLKKLETEGKKFEKEIRQKMEQISKQAIKEAGLATKEDLKRLEERMRKILKK